MADRFKNKLDEELQKIEESPAAPAAPPKKAPTTPKSPPKKSPKRNPFKPKKPKVNPNPKAEGEMTIDDIAESISEAYDDEVHPSHVDFWKGGAKEHIYSRHPFLSQYGDDLSRENYDYYGDTDARDVGIYAMEIMQLESRHKDELERLAKLAVSKVWGIDESMLTGSISRNVMADFKSEYGEKKLRGDRSDYDNLDDRTKKLIDRKITMNFLSQGAAIHHMESVGYLVEDQINKISPELLQLYRKFSHSAQKGIWMIDLNHIFNGTPEEMSSGMSGVKFDEEGEPKVIAVAVNFPIFVQELSKGSMQLLIMHGDVEEDEDTQANLVKYADNINDEILQFQIGPALWRRFLKVVGVKNNSRLPDIISELSVRDPDDVHYFVGNIVKNPEEATEYIVALLKGLDPEDVEDEGYQEDNFPDYMPEDI